MAASAKLTLHATVVGKPKNAVALLVPDVKNDNHPGLKLTYGELQVQIERVMRVLHQAGVKKGTEHSCTSRSVVTLTLIAFRGCGVHVFAKRY
jgi:hypothetical protein